MCRWPVIALHSSHVENMQSQDKRTRKGPFGAIPIGFHFARSKSIRSEEKWAHGEDSTLRPITCEDCRGGGRDKGDSIVVRVRPHRREQLRCPVCGRCCSCHDHVPARRWRAMDLGRVKCWISTGLRTCELPRARSARRARAMGSGFEDWVACLAVHSPISWVARLTRVEWKSVDSICRRV